MTTRTEVRRARLLALIATLFLLLPGGVVGAGPAYPEIVGDHVGPHARAHWPVRVRRLDSEKWSWSGGQFLGAAVPGQDGMVRIQAGGGVIHGVDATTAELRFKAGGLHRFFNYSGPALGRDGVAFGGNHTYLSAVGPDGKLRWQTALQASWIHRPPAVSPDGKTVYVVSDAVSLASLDAATGRVNWLRRDLGKRPWAPLCFDHRGRLVAGLRNRLVCFEPNGACAWSLPGDYRFVMSVGTRLVLGRSRSVALYDPAARAKIWEVDLGRKISDLAFGDDYRIVAAFSTGEVAQVDLQGTVRWVRRVSPVALGRPVTTKGSEILVADAKGTLYLLDSNGAVLQGLKTRKPGWRWRPAVGPDGHVYLNQKDRIVRIGGPERSPSRPRRATEMVVVADDFVVDVWVNGEPLPLSARRMLAETFGATTERIHVDLREGDWIVFHVVANRLRWGGASYFGVYATDDDRQRAFVTKADGAWSACDDPAQVAAFIRDRAAGTDRPAERIGTPWSGGRGMFRGRIPEDEFPGEPIWGTSASTWLKYVVPSSE